MSTTQAIESWMRHALALARRGEGKVEPNPMVGCVLFDNQGVIGAGYHEAFGGPHAERRAISDALQFQRESRLKGCTAVVTLEPCCHHGKTPPCTNALIECGVSRVVVATVDPFPAVSGRGIQQLREAGIEVISNVCRSEAAELIAPFAKRVTRQRPWVIAKWAMTLDGKIASATGHSQWISSSESRGQVHRLRGRVDAILVGIGTALADDPQLTARDTEVSRQALRIVVDSEARLPVTSRLAMTARNTPCLVWVGPQAAQERLAELRQAGVEVQQSQAADANQRLDELLQFLAVQKNATNVLVEGGGGLLGSLLQMGQIDECEVFIAPKLLGGQRALSPIGGPGFPTVDEALPLRVVESKPSGPDIWLRCRRATAAESA